MSGMNSILQSDPSYTENIKGRILKVLRQCKTGWCLVASNHSLVVEDFVEESTQVTL